jgi:hypothetical protein
MKKMLFATLFSICVFAVNASGSIIEFNDKIIYMPTWESSDWSDNYRDSIDYPDITGGRLTIEDNTLKSVSFDYKKRSCAMGDLFIDKDNNGYFDYVLNMESNSIYGFSDGQLSSEKGLNNDLYLTSNDMYDQGAIDGNQYRDDHFVALNLNNVLNLVNQGDASVVATFFNGINEKSEGSWPWPNWGEIGGVYEFDEFSLDMDGEFSLFFSPLCANDVIVARAAVPIPSTLLLMGSALFGLLGVRRRCADN